MLDHHVLKFVLRQIMNLRTKEVSQTIIKVIHDETSFINKEYTKYFTKVSHMVRPILQL
jgi:hypothetical protein